jgi:hypothetical protein
MPAAPAKNGDARTHGGHASRARPYCAYAAQHAAGARRGDASASVA